MTIPSGPLCRRAVLKLSRMVACFPAFLNSFEWVCLCSGGSLSTAIRTDPFYIMRVRLSLQRHELPEVKVLWPISKDVNTISELLDSINNAVPLESDGWGLDEYVVEVGGFECLHYANVRGVLQDNDEVM